MKGQSQPKSISQSRSANRPTKTGRSLLAQENLPVFKQLNPDSATLVAPAAPSPVRSDEQLMAAYRGGDRDSFVELVKRYERELFHFLARFLGDRTAAEDIFQETFLQVHQSAGTFDADRRFRPWLFTIAANKARDLIRSN